MVNRAVTGAHYGLRDWLAQRVTAVVMLLYTLLLVWLLLATPVIDHA
ncbi:MAG TPA: succinate dehydrogenase, hydrophobic membrane anchor protein, partial [Burkholderiales bacterium]|nr:succinate dehydrogenase, hydrophobic membrane anchor protein [Burkholderiales bacterium]